MAQEKVSQATIDNFKRVTKYDVKALLESFVVFAQSGSLRIYNYYNGDSTTYPTNSFNELERLQREMLSVTEKFRANANSFTTYDYWTLLEMVEDSMSRLDTIANYSVWTRSPILNGLVGRSSEMDYVLKAGESLEEISGNVQGDIDAQNQWVDVAMRNALNEEGYTAEGGVVLKVSFSTNNSLFIQAVVDNINTAEKTFGLDIDQVLTYENEDLKVLTYKDTVEQAAEILAGLRKGDNPFHPNDGIDEKTLIGNSIAAISFPIIFRQLVNTFSKDDTFSAISILDVSRTKDGIYIDFDVTTRAGEVLRKGLLV